MKFASIFAVAVTVLSVSQVQADELRQLDEHSYKLMGQVRTLDWDIRDGFVTARDYRTLCRMADSLRRSVRDIDDSIFRGRNLAVIESDLCRAKDDIADLARLISGCQLGDHRHTGIEMRLRSGGHAQHVDRSRLLRGSILRVAEIEKTIDCMIAEVKLLQRPVPAHGVLRGHDPRVVPHHSVIVPQPTPPVNPVPYEVRPFRNSRPDDTPGPRLTPPGPTPPRSSNFRNPSSRPDVRTRTIEWKGLRFTVNLP